MHDQIDRNSLFLPVSYGLIGIARRDVEYGQGVAASEAVASMESGVV